MDIHLTARAGTRFQYDVHTAAQYVAYPPQNFPSHTFSNPLPSEEQHYLIPTVSPYAMSVVTAACAVETPAEVENMHTIHNWIGEAAVQADVTINPE